MKRITSFTTVLAGVFLSATAGAITIDAPQANAVVSGKVSFEANGDCQLGYPVKINVRDVNNVFTDTLWTACQGEGFFASPVSVSSLADGTLKVKAYQSINGATISAYVNVIKKTGTSPTPTPTPKPTATPVPPVASGGIIYGVNGHDKNQATYPLAQAEARFKILDARNLRTYRFDLVPGNTDVLNTLIPLAKKYNISLRPMLYPTSQSAAYNFVKQYRNDIKIWEIGNEQDYSRDGAQDRINAMVATYKGVKQASDEVGAGLKTTINIMACAADDTSAGARCPGDRNGTLWFLDQAKASGFNFDYISFHWYPFYGDKGYWMDMYLGQMRTAATKYKTKIFYNEMNCGDVYQGTTDGGHAGDKACYDSIKQIFDVLRASYSDIVAEINMYEMLDEPDHPVVAEKHFGMMYNLNSPKSVLDLVTQYANKK